MIDRIRVLTQLQLTNKTRLHAKHSKRIYSYIAIRILMVILITVVIALMLHVIKNLLYIPVNNYFMIFILLLTQVLSISAAVSGLSVDIYQSKDNQILLTMPAKNDEIFLSKLIVYYINEFLKNLYFLFPFLLAYGYISGLGVVYYLNLLPMIVILPFIAVFLGAIISIIFSLIHNYLNRHTWLTFLMLLLLIAGAFWLIFYLVGFIPDEIRLVQLYNSFIVGLAKFMQTVASFASIYTIIGQLLNGNSVLVNYAVIIGTIGFLFIINYLIAKPLFFRLTSKSSEHSRTKNHHAVNRMGKSLFWTFLRKEVTIAKRSPNELLSNYAVLIFLPVIMYVLNTIYMSINRSSLGNQFVLIFNVLITLIIIAASNTASAVAITTEGYEFVLLKTAPSKTQQVAWAKMAFNFLITSVLLLLSFILFQIALPVFNKADIWLLFAFAFILNASHILWSFQMDITSPKLSDYASTGSLSNNHNIAKSLSKGLVLALVFTLISIILFVFFNDIAWIILILFAVLWLSFRIYSFRAYLNAYFIDIEY